ncbi:Hypothetical protein KVN_LOCUS533 [uncultured virus]|nr:Hypothetical protein KVN_LOCUS533 [uncultured virus]
MHNNYFDKMNSYNDSYKSLKFKNSVRDVIYKDLIFDNIFKNPKINLLVKDSISEILDSDETINTILLDHQNNIEEKIEIFCKQILKKITSDPQYHEINKIYFDTFKSRCDDEIELFKLKYGNDLKILEEKNKNMEKKIINITLAFGFSFSALIGLLYYKF